MAIRYAGIFALIAAVVIVPLALAGAALYYMTAMPGHSHRGSLPPLTAQERQLAARLRTHVTAIASSEHNVTHYQKLEEAATYVETVRGRDVVAMVSMETIGYYSDAMGSQHYPFPFALIYPDKGNFLGFVGTLGSRTLVRRAVASFREHASFPSEGVAAPGFIPGVDWSDHWSYGEYG